MKKNKAFAIKGISLSSRRRKNKSNRKSSEKEKVSFANFIKSGGKVSNRDFLLSDKINSLHRKVNMHRIEEYSNSKTPIMRTRKRIKNGKKTKKKKISKNFEM